MREILDYENGSFFSSELPRNAPLVPHTARRYAHACARNRLPIRGKSTSV
jgi:hypothetical protein